MPRVLPTRSIDPALLARQTVILPDLDPPVVVFRDRIRGRCPLQHLANHINLVETAANGVDGDRRWSRPAKTGELDVIPRRRLGPSRIGVFGDDWIGPAIPVCGNGVGPRDGPD